MKKLLTLILALLLSFSPVMIRAQEEENRETAGHGSDIVVNPLYPDTKVPDDVVAQSNAYASSKDEVHNDAALNYGPYYSLEEAGAAMRAAMVAREREFTIEFTITTDDFSSFYTNYKFLDDIAEAAFRHTGNPDEGDSIRWDWSFVQRSWSYWQTGNSYRFELTYTYDYKTTAAQQAELKTAVNNLLNQLDLSGKSSYEKVRTIYDYLCDNITYDYENLNNDNYDLKYTAYAALINKTAVCQGYASLLYRMLLEEGIDVRMIAGIGNGGRHAWNIIRLGNLYYNADSTWDAGESYYTYFLKSPTTFPDHERDDEYNTADFHRVYPMSSTDYDPNNPPYGIKIDGNGMMTWGTIGGTDEYDIYLNDGYAGSVYSPSFDLRGFLLDNNYPEGYYPTKVIAWSYTDAGWKDIEYLYGPDYRFTAPNGTMAAPASAWWDGTKATWTAVPGATKYYIYLYQNDVYQGGFSTEGKNWADFNAHLIGSQNRYDFLVSAAAPGYGRSEYVQSDYTYGHDKAYERLAGKNRYDTSLTVAKQITDLNVSYGGTIAAVIATGKNFPDALSGSYLAGMYDAPLLLISKNSASDVCTFIKNNIRKDGKIIILGGTGAVPDEWIAPLFSEYKDIVRIAGKSRYDTNLDILNLAGVGDQDYLLVCTGKSFADSLSASSVDIPIFLVGDKLNDKQKAFLSSKAKNCKFYIIGGTGAVSETVEYELGNYGKVLGRIYGKNRYETSKLVGEFFYGGAKTAFLVTGKDFPDGLSGGPYAHRRRAPILLVSPNSNTYAREFADNNGVGYAYVLGGEGAVSTANVEYILGIGSSR